MAICKECKKDVVKIPVMRGSIARFSDENHRIWNGACCPECYKEYNRKRMRATRQKQSGASLPKSE